MLAAAKSLQSCPTLCDPIDGSPLGSSAHRIFQARVLEWGAIVFSEQKPRATKKKFSKTLKFKSRLFINVTDNFIWAMH